MDSLLDADDNGASGVLEGPSRPTLHVPPSLSDGEMYHVFISYSSTDSQWTLRTISRLEACGLQVCYHERDFTPGRSVLENMSDCIQQSQKVLLLLSPEFMRSRWCLLEANMSAFTDCLQRKPIVPVLLEPGVSVPLHLCHLTYLEADHPDFMDKLLKVLCTPNQQLQSSTVHLFQPPSVYNGKVLQPLTAVNDEEEHKWKYGWFSPEVPDQLRLIVKDREKFKWAVLMINEVVQIKSFWTRTILFCICVILSLVLVVPVFYMVCALALQLDPGKKDTRIWKLTVVCAWCVMFTLGLHIMLWKAYRLRRMVWKVQKAVGRANIVMSEEKVLMGCRSNPKEIYLVYVSLDGCKREFAETFSADAEAEEMFERALTYFSQGYACYLSKRAFPFYLSIFSGHLEGGVCFCQYVSEQLRRDTWE